MSDAVPVSVQLKVPFHDCDPLYVVWHGRYFEYMEVARSALLASVELDVKDIRAMGFRMYITDARCRYLHPLRYNDEIRVTARFTESSPLIRIAYEVTNLTSGKKSATTMKPTARPMPTMRMGSRMLIIDSTATSTSAS